MPIDLDDLLALCRCHSTPGDEADVAAFLAARWAAAGWDVARHGGYAVTARYGAPDPARPTLLIAAHMDSPGFTVERVEGRSLRLIALGGPRCEPDRVTLRLKTARGTYLVEATRDPDAEDRRPVFTADFAGKAAAGDRACWAVAPRVVDDAFVLAPFLDNRLGCFALTALAARLAGADLPANVVLGATSSEEMGGFGADVLAANCAADLTVCLDATYEDDRQDVRLGDGPVLTLSDASILVSPARRDAVAAWFAARGLPLQTEVYNHSGTDARAFPQQGRAGLVLPLLLATTGNHSPVETVAVADIESWLAALQELAGDLPAAITAWRRSA